MNRFKVIYEDINGGNKTVTVVAEDKETAAVTVYNNYPDCLQVLSIM